MKTLLLAAVLLGCATAGYAQTAPATTPSSSTPAVSGTKNVGADQADAPKAPGMQTSAPVKKYTGSAKAKRRNSSSKSGQMAPNQ